MRSRSMRLVISATVLATAAWTLTACQSDKASDAASTSSAPSTATSQSTSSGAVSATPTTGTTATGTPEASATGSGSGSASNAGTSTKAGPAASGAPCASSQLTVSQQDPSVGAGQFYAKIVFKNNASTSCTLTGFPGVSYVKAAGVQSGNPATRTGATYHTVTLAAHGTAYATMHDANGQGGYSKGQCDLTAVQGLRIYPPNQKGALFLPDRTEHCAGTGIHPLTIGPVES